MYSPHHPFLKYLSLRPSLNISEQISYPYRTTGEVIVLRILVLPV
jgi:hypothetical protein